MTQEIGPWARHMILYCVTQVSGMPYRNRAVSGIMNARVIIAGCRSEIEATGSRVAVIPGQRNDPSAVMGKSCTRLTNEN